MTGGFRTYRHPCVHCGQSFSTYLPYAGTCGRCQFAGHKGSHRNYCQVCLGERRPSGKLTTPRGATPARGRNAARAAAKTFQSLTGEGLSPSAPQNPISHPVSQSSRQSEGKNSAQAEARGQLHQRGPRPQKA